MVKIVFVGSDGSRRTVGARVGGSVMSAAMTHGIDELYAECGGAAMCATCHVYVDHADLGRLQPMSDVENEMLDATAAQRLPNSRLSCQVTVTRELDGLVVHLPECQV